MIPKFVPKYGSTSPFVYVSLTQLEALSNDFSLLNKTNHPQPLCSWVRCQGYLLYMSAHLWW